MLNATTGALIATLANPSPAANDSFGYSVAVSATYLNSTTVQDDDSLDTLRGGQGLDWFFAAYLEDILSDLNRGGSESVFYL